MNNKTNAGITDNARMLPQVECASLSFGIQRGKECWNKKSLAQSRKGAKNRRKNAGIKELETKNRGRSFDNPRFRSTFDIIRAAEKGLLPDKIMLNVHPQRWDDKPWPWVKEFVGQNVKNVVKRYFYVRR